MSRCIIYLILFSVLFSQATYNLYSPALVLPSIGENETMHFGFWLHADMPDWDGSCTETDPGECLEGGGDGNLDDYYRISINDFTATVWHSANFNSDDGNNFWCADEEISGYLDSWIQYLDTPSISVGSGAGLSVEIYFEIEDATGPFVVGSCTDGWDAANVRVSSDGGSTWALLENSNHPYDFECGYGWIYNNDKYETGGSLNHLAKGWGGSSNGWFNFSADLSQYSGQEIIVRFAFGSDPAKSTADDALLTGFQVDDIIIEDDTGELFSDSGDDMSQMNASGAVWINQFYDYGSEEDNRPGATEWTFYSPGMAFAPSDGEANIYLDISEFAEKTIQFRIQSRYDNNHDGGQGEGLFIDDFVIYKIYSATYGTPVGLSADTTGDAIILTWDDMNLPGTEDFIFDNDKFDYVGGIRYDGWAGKRFDIYGNGTINTVSIYNVNQSSVTISFGVFSKTGALFDLDPIYPQQQIELASGPGWNEVAVTGWNVENSFIIAHEVSSSFGAAYDSTNTSLKSYLRFGEGAWDRAVFYGIDEDGDDVNDIQLTGEFGIRANITYEGADVAYNVYRDDNPVIPGTTKIAYGLDQSTYTDTDVVNNATYEYAVSATYPDGVESDMSDPVSATPFADTVHEEGYDDGSSESEFNAGSGNFSAVRFTANNSGEGIDRFKWYQNGSGGAFYIKVWDDAELFEDIGVDGIGEEDGVYTQGEPFTDSNENDLWDSHRGLPGNEIYSAVQASGSSDGWNDKDLTAAGLNVSGDFWIGTKEFSSSQPFGLDNSSNSDNSYQRVGLTGYWTKVVEGNLMYRIYLDSGESSERVISSWDNQEEETREKYPIYTLKWENKRLRRVPLLINEKQVYKLQEHPPTLHRSITAADETIPLIGFTFEDELTALWGHDTGWNLTTSEYAPQSPSHSFHSPNIEVCGIVEGGSVWPGNTNADESVSVVDLLPIGMYWHQAVCERSELANDMYKWEAQPLPESSCISHADANGDGIVDIADILAIIVNWEKATSNSDGMAYIVDNSCSNTETDLSRYYRNFQNIYNNLTGSSNPEIQMRNRLEELFGFSSGPSHYQIYQSYPNPFNPIASIPYFLPQESLVALALYNIVGQKVLTESAFVSSAGYHEIEIDGTELSSGVYFYQFIIDRNELTPMKMVLLK